jgi:hypothetical protein
VGEVSEDATRPSTGGAGERVALEGHWDYGGSPRGAALARAFPESPHMPSPARTVARRRYGAAASALLACAVANAQVDAPVHRTPLAEPVDFARDVLPLLADRCFACHGPDEAAREANLRLDLHTAALAPAASGRAAIVPGDPAASSLVARIEHTNPRRRMPPSSTGKALDAAERALLARWIEEGASWATHWAWTAPRATEAPQVADEGWCREPLDRFILARLESEGLSHARRADWTTLLRRATLALTGLPPSVAEVDKFVAEVAREEATHGPRRPPRPDAYDRAVERLLASPHYGERMALPWLDAARYADSNGFQQDGDTHQWVWRDWLVRALNEDVPLDRLVELMLAGDLLPADSAESRVEQQVASALQRLHLLNGEGGAIAEEQRNNIVFDRVDVFATGFLGVTAACAQCHDHKFDPLTQRDYYALFDFFNRVPESGVPPGGGQYRIADPWIHAGTATENERLRSLEIAASEADEVLSQALADPAVGAAEARWRTRAGALPHHPSEVARFLADESATLHADAEAVLRERFIAAAAPRVVERARAAVRTARTALESCRASRPRVMVMSDARPRVTHVLARGNYEAPLDPVTAATPSFLPPLPIGVTPDRLALARWLTAPEQPLFARVMVNRAWQQLFGVGLVRTSEDFGVQGEAPSHPELLDTLAVTLRESGWSAKELHRSLVTSATFRQSSKLTGEPGARLYTLDPANRLLARGPRQRLPAMVLRDVALVASGLFVRDLGGKPVYPYQPPDIWSGLAITKERSFDYPLSSGADLYRRSLYTFWRRTVAPGNMFDASQRQACNVRPATTSTPLHALTTLNDPTWVEASRALAQVVLQAYPSTRSAESASMVSNDVLSLAFRRVVARSPAELELALLRQTYRRAHAAFAIDLPSAERLLAVGASARDPALDPVDHAALTVVCLNLFNLDEALTCE